MSRRAARVDANQADIVKALRSAGCLVEITSALGNGFPDIVAYHVRVGVRLLEIKDGTRIPSERQLTPDEAKFAKRWGGTAFYAVVESEREALAAMGLTNE